jgi:anthranilate synthase component II
MFLLIDNYDSFTYNLWHFLGELGAEVIVRRNDALSVADALAMKPQGIIISPGPSDPDRAGICLDLVRQAGNVPLLGVCLGHQALGQAMGGKITAIHHDTTGVFARLPNPLKATRYHSLIVERASLPESLRVNGWTEDGLVMGIAHRERPLHGVQFHPESIASVAGHSLLKNFLELAAQAAIVA